MVERVKQGPKKRLSPVTSMVLDTESLEFFEYYREETGMTQSAIIRLAIRFFKKHHVLPEIHQKMIDQREEEERAALRPVGRRKLKAVA